MRHSIKSIPKLIISIALPLSAGFLSSLLTKNYINTYENLIKPSFAPPNWIFAPVWTILCIVIGIASYRVWTSSSSKEDINDALFFYIIQLILNFTWSILFFRLDLKFSAFIEIILLLIFIIITTKKFYRIDKISGYLMIPYILWVSFATILNYSIWMLNR